MSRSFSHSPIDFRNMPTAIKALVAANVLGFLLSQVVGGQFYDLFGLVPLHVLRDRWVWQPLTYLFIHGGFMHLLFNLFALWMFGMPVESQWGPFDFIKYYFICGIGAAICTLLLSPNSPYPVIGASGAVYGLLVAFAMLYPDAVVYLYFFLPIKASHMAILFGVIEFFAGTANTTPGVARFAHLGGMVVGYLYIRWWFIVKIQAKALFSGILPAGMPSPPRGRKGTARKPSPAPEPSLADTVTKIDQTMVEIDRILDKISAQGKDSLSDEEREILRRHATKQKPEGHA